MTHQRNDDLAIGGGLEVVGGLQVLPDETVVVDLAVDGEDNALIGIGKWLSSALCFLVSCCSFGKSEIDGSGPTNADDAEPFMAQNCKQKVLAHFLLFICLLCSGVGVCSQGLVHTRVVASDAAACAGLIAVSETGTGNRFRALSEIAQRADSLKPTNESVTRGTAGQTHSNQVPGAGLCRKIRKVN